MLLHITGDDEMTKKQWFTHYEKSCLPKPHYLTTKTQKKIHIQMICNYPFGIITIVQLFP
jgi:hypothetical protein